MNSEELIEYINNKNDYKALEKCYLYNSKHSRNKDNIYRENYIKSFIYRSNFKTNTLKKFKNMVNSLNLNILAQKPKDQTVIKEENKRFE